MALRNRRRVLHIYKLQENIAKSECTRMLCALICEIRSPEKSFVYIEENPQRNRNVKSIKSTYKSRKYLMSAETNKNNY